MAFLERVSPFLDTLRPRGTGRCGAGASPVGRRETRKETPNENPPDENGSPPGAAHAGAGELSQNAFLTVMSHELRSPLGAIQGYTHLLHQELDALEAAGHPVPPTLREFTDGIEHNAIRVLALVSNMLHLASLEAGEAAVDVRAVAVEVPVRAAVERMRPYVEAKGLALEFEILEGVRVWADPDRLEQVLDHLLGNAAKFTVEGSVTLRVEHAGRHVEIGVRDTGVGLGGAARADLFAPFVQGDMQLNRPFEGAGLGLALVRRLVELMGGEVLVEEAKGCGACFTVRLAAVGPL